MGPYKADFGFRRRPSSYLNLDALLLNEKADEAASNIDKVDLTAKISLNNYYETPKSTQEINFAKSSSDISNKKIRYQKFLMTEEEAKEEESIRRSLSTS